MFRSVVYGNCVVPRLKKIVRIKLSKDSNESVRAELKDAGSGHNLKLRYSTDLFDPNRIVASCNFDNAKYHATRMENRQENVFSTKNLCPSITGQKFSSTVHDPCCSDSGETEKSPGIENRCAHLPKCREFLSNSVLSASRINYCGSFYKPVGARQFSSTVDGIADVPQVQLTGFWRAMSESAPVEFAQESLVWLHAATGLPWWATVVLTTVTVRGIVTIPLALYQNYIFAKVENLQGEMNAIVAELKAETTYAVKTFKWTEKYGRAVYNRSLKQQWDKLIVRENCHPLKGTILVWAQIPMWITLSAALRNLCYMLPSGNINAQVTFMELTVGGFGWIPNLTDVDHSFIIPVSLGVLNLVIIEIQSMMRIKDETRFQKYLTNFFRLLSIGMVPLAACVPSCISLYWVSSSAFGLFQNLLLMSPKIRRIGGVPQTKSERTNPYQHLLERIKGRFNLYDGVDNARKV